MSQPGQNGVHRLFLGLALLFLLPGGTLLGAWLLLGLAGWLPLERWPQLVATHGLFQVHGFVVMFTLGVALMVVPRFMNVPLALPGLARFSALVLTAALLLEAGGAAWALARALETAAVLAFAVVLRRTQAGRVSPRGGTEGGADRIHGLFLACGLLWLLAALWVPDRTRSLDLVLWGFAGLYITGIGVRVHPSILSLPSPRGRLLWGTLVLWNGSLVLRLLDEPLAGAVLQALACASFLAALQLHRRPGPTPSCAPAWLQAYVRVSYFWLGLASLSGVVVALAPVPSLALGAGRHLLASGFVLTMMFGMALRMVPTFEGRPLAWEGAPVVIFWLLLGGNLLRVGGQALLGQSPAALASLVAGGTLQVAAIGLFAAVLGATLGRLPTAAVPFRPGFPPLGREVQPL